MRSILLLAFLLSGCSGVVAFGLELTGRAVVHGASKADPCVSDCAPGPGARPTVTSERDRNVIAEARQLTNAAAQAADRGDCTTVVRIRQRVLELPEVQLEGGVHDVIFLREPAIVQCLAKPATGPS